MMSAVLDHLWQSTLFAVLAGILTLALRKAGAQVRYGLWFAASAKFLVPFAALAALGRLLAPAVRPPVQAASGAALIAEAAQPFSQAPSPVPTEPAMALAAVPAAHAAIAPTAVQVLLGVWALGCAVVLLFWMARWAKVRAAVRQATPLAIPAPMPVLASSWMREPGLVGLWRPVLLVPDDLFAHLDRRGIDALLAHETCHLGRRDNLTAATHMLVEALFWFHPLAWWIGARLIDERERACDEAVVGAGHSRGAYARSLVECCRLYLQSPLSCVAGASGSNLKARVEQIMTAPVRSPLSRRGKATLVAIGTCAIASPVAAGWLASPAGQDVATRAVAIAARAAAVPVHDAGQPGGTPAPAPDRNEPPHPTALARNDAGQAASVASPADPAPGAAAPASTRTQPLPGVEAVVRRWIDKLQLHQSDEEDMSAALVAAARPQETMMMQMFSAFGPVKDVRFVRITPDEEDAYQVDFVHAKIEVVAGPLTPDGKLDLLRWRPIWVRDGADAQPGVPPAPVASLDSPRLSVTPVPAVKVASPLLVRVSDRTPQEGQPLGPGHYEESSGLKSSGRCDEYSPWYSISTRPIEAGHVITNFHYELRGRNHCDAKQPDKGLTATCDVTTNKPDKKTVQFQLQTNSNYCRTFGSLRDGPDEGLSSGGVITEAGAVTRSEMVISYDVQ